MLLTPTQIEEAVRIIKFQTANFIMHNAGAAYLTDEDKEVLKEYGVKIERLQFLPIEEQFYFGRLAAILGDQASGIEYEDFRKYLLRGQFIPLSAIERSTLDFLEQGFADDLRTLCLSVENDIKGVILEETQAYDMLTTQRIKEQLIEGLSASRSKKEILSNIGHLTGGWKYDLGRIVATETQNAFQYGKVTSYMREREVGVEDKVFYKEVFPGACKYCIANYLTAGIGSEPVLFSYEELIRNGTNVNKKRSQWSAVLGTMHPWCRCELRTKTKDAQWDKEEKRFKEVGRTPPSGIKIKINNKTYST